MDFHVKKRTSKQNILLYRFVQKHDQSHRRQPGYISAPGYIDISDLKFLPADIPLFIHGDDDDDEIGGWDGDDDEDDRDDDGDDGDDEADRGGDNGGGDGTGDGGDDTGEGGDDTGDGGDGTGDGGDDNGEGGDGTGDEGDGDNGGPAGTDDDGDSGANNQGNSTAVPPSSIASNTTNSATHSPGGGNRKMRRHLDGEKLDKPDSTVDIVVFRLQDSCANTMDGCDWADLGIGAHDDEVDGGINYCCSKDAASRGICDESRIGRLIVNQANFVGEVRDIFVPGNKDEPLKLEEGNRFDIDYDGSYVLILANCDDDGREMLVLGSMEWMSSHGLLPGDLLGLLFYYIIIFLVYLVLFIGYGCGMRIYQDSAIPIQRYIIGTIGLGLIESFFLTVDLIIFNQAGVQSDFVVYAGKYRRSDKLSPQRHLICLTLFYFEH